MRLTNTWMGMPISEMKNGVLGTGGQLASLVTAPSTAGKFCYRGHCAGRPRSFEQLLWSSPAHFAERKAMTLMCDPHRIHSFPTVVAAPSDLDSASRRRPAQHNISLATAEFPSSHLATPREISAHTTTVTTSARATERQCVPGRG